MEDYLKAIYVLQSEQGPPVSTSAIAEYLDKTSPSVTDMLGKLEDRGLVEREPYRGTELTAEGEAVALEIVRHHRLLEAFLAERLDYDWSEVHEEADALEHHISEAFERRVAETSMTPPSIPTATRSRARTSNRSTRRAAPSSRTTRRAIAWS